MLSAEVLILFCVFRATVCVWCESALEGWQLSVQFHSQVEKNTAILTHCFWIGWLLLLEKYFQIFLKIFLLPDGKYVKHITQCGEIFYAKKIKTIQWTMLMEWA